MAGDDRVNLPGACTEVEVSDRERTTNHPRPNDQETHSDAIRSRLPRHLMAYDPPPPYPGLPSNPLSTVATQTQSLGQQQPKPELRHSITNEVLYAFNRCGQMVPAHQVATVTSHPSIPGQIGTADTATTTIPRATPRASIITEQHRDHAQQAVRVRTRNVRNTEQPNDYFKTSLTLLVLCSIQGNLPATICTVVSVAYSFQAQKLNLRRQYNRARRKSIYALMFNTLAVIEYVTILIGVVVFALVYFLVDMREEILWRQFRTLHSARYTMAPAAVALVAINYIIIA